MADKHGIERMGFLTLTTPDPVSPKEYQRRFNSLRTHVLHERYGDRIKIVERGSKSGLFHGHLLIVLPFDIRTGCNFTEFAQGNYQSASQALRDEWAFLREILPKFSFGRHELLPIKSTADGIAFYVGKYVSKHVGARKKEDKGVRLVEYGKAARHWNSRFAWNTPKAKYFRQKVAAIAKEMCVEDGGMSAVLGRNWCWKYRFEIRRTILSEQPHLFDLGPWPADFTKEALRICHAGQRLFLTPREATIEVGLKDTEKVWWFLYGPNTYRSNKDSRAIACESRELQAR